MNLTKAIIKQGDMATRRLSRKDIFAGSSSTKEEQMKAMNEYEALCDKLAAAFSALPDTMRFGETEKNISPAEAIARRNYYAAVKAVSKYTNIQYKGGYDPDVYNCVCKYIFKYCRSESIKRHSQKTENPDGTVTVIYTKTREVITGKEVRLAFEQAAYLAATGGFKKLTMDKKEEA